MKSNPIISAANTCAVLGFVLFIIAFLAGENIPNSAVLTLPLVLWVVGAFFSAFFLIFLGPVFKRVKRSLSLTLFLTVGFVFPFSVGYFMSSIGAHGNPSSLESDYFRAILLVLIYSVIGCCAAFASWKSLNAYSKKNI